MKIWLLILACCTAAVAIPYPEVQPPGTTVTIYANEQLSGPGTLWEPNQDRPLPQNPSLVFSKPGYETAVLSPSYDQLSELRVSLRPLTWSQAGLDWWGAHSIPLGMGLGLGAALVALGWQRWRLRSYPPDPADLLIRRKLGPWRLVARLGQGGMATVYKALPALTLSEAGAVAVKVMDPAYGQSDAEARPRFEREARLAVSLEHPNIVRTLSHGEHGGLLYLVMELVRGIPLSQRLAPAGLSLHEAVSLARPVFAALHHAHSRGVIHRDVKPDNVMLANDGRVLLMDFGVARAADVTAITPTGLAMGSPSYMPPEQLTGGVVDPRADQYSLGIMLYQLVTGRLPFAGGQPSEVALLHVTDSPEPPRTWRADLPPSVERVILKMIRKDPEARFPDLTAAQEALERALREPDAFAEWEAPRPAPRPAPSAPKPDPVLEGEGEDTVGVPRMP